MFRPFNVKNDRFRSLFGSYSKFPFERKDRNHNMKVSKPSNPLLDVSQVEINKVVLLPSIFL